MKIVLVVLACLRGANALSRVPFVKVPVGQTSATCDLHKLHLCSFELYCERGAKGSTLVNVFPAEMGLLQWPQSVEQLAADIEHFIGTDPSKLLMHCG